MNTADLRTLWVGDIEAWMNEKLIEDVFSKVGKVVSVKLIRQKETSLPAGYCFVEFQTHDQAERILMNYNQQLIPGTQHTFRMNWGKNPTNTGIIKQTTTQANNGYMNNQYGMMQQPMMQMPPAQEFSIYVGELELGVNEQQLAEHFRAKYSSVVGSKIITEPSSKMSKGYGFVKFSNPIEGQRAIHEMNGSLFKGKFIKVSQAVSRTQQQGAGVPGATGYAQAGGYGASTGAVDMYGYNNQYYPTSQTSYEQYYYQQQQQTQNGQTSTQYQYSQYPYQQYSQYYQNGAYGTDPYGQTAAQTSAYGQQAGTTPSTASQTQAQQGQSQYQQQYAQQYQYPQQGQTQAAHTTSAQSQYGYGQAATTAGQQGQIDQYSQQMNHYGMQQGQAATNAQYGQQQYQQQTQQAQQPQAHQQAQTNTAQNSTQQSQYNSADKKEDISSIPTPSDKEYQFIQKPSCEFIGYQPEYVSMTGDIEFVLKHNIY